MTRPKTKKKFIFIAGPCVIEDKDKTLAIASYLKKLTADYPLEFIFKASFDKANRTQLKSFRGPGLKEGLRILKEIKTRLAIPILSDVHETWQIKHLGDILDLIQIPAFLCRQTDLIICAAKTNKTINIKKGQFISPDDVRHIVEKIESTGNQKIYLTERGTCFGYNNLVVDFRSFLIMKKLGYPVIFDLTHSLQKPSAKKGISGGELKFAEPLGLAAVACGVDGIFMEVHPQPQKALSDKYTSYDLSKVRKFIEKVIKIREALNAKS